MNPTQLLAVATTVLCGPSAAWAAEALHLKVGETRLLPQVRAQGVSNEDPEVLDAELRQGGVALTGRADGEAHVHVIAVGGKQVTWTVRVGSGLRRAPDAGVEARPRFGGKRLPDAHCDEQDVSPESRAAVERAGALLQQGQAEPARHLLERALVGEPNAAVLHAYLGAVAAKLGDAKSGAAHYETFVLSCSESPRAAAVRQTLNAFERTGTR